MPQFIHDKAIINDTAHNLSSYLGRANTDDIALPTFDLDHLTEAIAQISADTQKASTHANILGEAARTARMKASYLQSVQNSYRNLSVPLVRMPPELLIAVFQHCVDSDTSGHVLSRNSMPWVLAQTCRKWRETALSTPSLWAIVRFNSHVISSDGCSAQMLRVWLERSQGNPISCLAIFDDTKPLKFHRQILELLIAHSTRWGIVDLDLGRQTDLYYMLSAISQHLPLLYSCRFKLTIPESVSLNGDSVLTHLHAPVLREATFFVLSESNDIFPEIVPPWPQLETLVWFPDTPRSFLDIAPSLNHLRYCYLNIAQNMEGRNTQRLTLPCLHHLYIFGPYQAVTSILNRLSLPSLEDLDMDFEEFIGAAADHLLTCLGRLQGRSRCRLRRLSSPFSLFSSCNAPLLTEKIDTVDELRIFISSAENVQKAIDNFLQTRIFTQLRTLHLLFRHRPTNHPALFSRMVDIVEHRRLSHGDNLRLESLSLDMIRTPPSEERISVRLEPFGRLLELQHNGLVLLGDVDDEYWWSDYGDAFRSSCDFERAARRWTRFGYSDWLCQREVVKYLQN